MLYLIGIGLNDEKDISLKGLEAIKKCRFVYLENYTSKFNTDVKKLEKLCNKKILLADRNMVENSQEIINNAKKYNVAFLVIGDVFSATTHINFILECRKNNIKSKVIHNASIITAVGETGLEIYKFGKITSIPFNNENIKIPIETINKNLKDNMHTLIILDLDPLNNKYLSANEALKYLVKNSIPENTKVLICSQLGGDPEIVYSEIKNLLKKEFKKFPQSIIIPSNKLHFIEEETLNLWKI
ncbi:diphthine synthase [Candidatus Woesearchaeota archaeon]|nr:diphthine synthase [Candidatus Woesearchaeota archaeon]